MSSTQGSVHWSLSWETDSIHQSLVQIIWYRITKLSTLSLFCYILQGRNKCSLFLLVCSKPLFGVLHAASLSFRSSKVSGMMVRFDCLTDLPPSTVLMLLYLPRLGRSPMSRDTQVFQVESTHKVRVDSIVISPDSNGWSNMCVAYIFRKKTPFTLAYLNECFSFCTCARMCVCSVFKKFASWSCRVASAQVIALQWPVHAVTAVRSAAMIK